MRCSAASDRLAPTCSSPCRTGASRSSPRTRPVRQILTEWARVGQTQDRQRRTHPRRTDHARTEQRARSAGARQCCCASSSGYIAAPRRGRRGRTARASIASSSCRRSAAARPPAARRRRRRSFQQPPQFISSRMPTTTTTMPQPAAPIRRRPAARPGVQHVPRSRRSSIRGTAMAAGRRGQSRTAEPIPNEPPVAAGRRRQPHRAVWRRRACPAWSRRRRRRQQPAVSRASPVAAASRARRPRATVRASRRRHERGHRRRDAQARPDAAERAAHAEGRADEPRGRTRPRARRRRVAAGRRRRSSSSAKIRSSSSRSGGRQDLADKEAAEIRVLEAYPAAGRRSGRRSSSAVADAIAGNRRDVAEGHGPRDEGGHGQARGQSVDGKTVNELVRQKLAALNFGRRRLTRETAPHSHPSLCARCRRAFWRDCADETGQRVRSRHRASVAEDSRVTPALPARRRSPAGSSASSRDQVLAGVLRRRQRDGRVRRRVPDPNLVRDLFAEGAMSARVRADLHAPSDAPRQGRRVAARQQRAERAARSSTGALVVARHRLRASRWSSSTPAISRACRASSS